MSQVRDESISRFSFLNWISFTFRNLRRHVDCLSIDSNDFHVQEAILTFFLIKKVFLRNQLACLLRETKPNRRIFFFICLIFFLFFWIEKRKLLTLRVFIHWKLLLRLVFRSSFLNNLCADGDEASQRSKTRPHPSPMPRLSFFFWSHFYSYFYVPHISRCSFRARIIDRINDSAKMNNLSVRNSLAGGAGALFAFRSLTRALRDKFHENSPRKTSKIYQLSKICWASQKLLSMWIYCTIRPHLNCGKIGKFITAVFFSRFTFHNDPAEISMNFPLLHISI